MSNIIQMSKTIAFHTFGCKLNFSETSTISRKLPGTKYTIINFKEKADIYVIHSCAVTAAAEKKCKQTIRSAKKRNPESQVVVMGCFAQLSPNILSEMEEVDLILGSKDKFNLPDYLETNLPKDTTEIHTSDISKTKTFTPSFSLVDRTRSFVKIQDGCDYFCSYCTIPLARGRSRSGNLIDTIGIVETIAQSDVREIVLTGVNIGEFGRNNNESFFDLIRKLDIVEGIDRIRISSIEPDLLSNDIIEFVARADKFLPHFHLPLQSGSNKILKSMQRKYNRELFAGRIKKIKQEMPLCCIAVDIIVGFPGETEEDFMDTYHFINGLDISYLHVFSYSGRPNTASMKLDGKIKPEIIKLRSKMLHQLSAQKKMSFYDQNKGKTFNVLFESDPNKGYLFGFTENYIRVKAPVRKELINSIVPVKLITMDNNGNYLWSNH